MKLTKPSVIKEIVKRRDELGQLQDLLTYMDRAEAILSNGGVRVKRKYKRRKKGTTRRGTAAYRQKMGDAMKKRWAKAHAAGRNAL